MGQSYLKQSTKAHKHTSAAGDGGELDVTQTVDTNSGLTLAEAMMLYG